MPRSMPPAFLRKRTPDAAASPIVGGKPLTTGNALKGFWNYVKTKDKKGAGLQAGREIHVSRDPALAKLFPGKRTIQTKDIMGGLVKHLK